MTNSGRVKYPEFADRASVLLAQQRLKMARSAHAYVRGATLKFYEWLEASNGHAIPDGPPIWICGDCHVGNLGPVADVKGNVTVEIRDLDQAVIGNPAHDIIRLALSLATAARGSDLPGVTTAHIVEHLMDGYDNALGGDDDKKWVDAPAPVIAVLRKALQRRWRHLAAERLEDVKPEIPLGRKFWPLSADEKSAIEALCGSEGVRELVTHLHSRKDRASLKILDAAYWVKGCSSLGRLRYAVLLRVKDQGDGPGMCLIDIKEATSAAAPRAEHAHGTMPANSAERVVMGARALAPPLGNRMIAAELMGKPVIVRELLPQDLKVELDQLTQSQACKAARYLGNVVGRAHARQMNSVDRRAWKALLQKHRSATLDAPYWLWNSVVDLVSAHEKAYLDHCRSFALEPASRAMPLCAVAPA